MIEINEEKQIDPIAVDDEKSDELVKLKGKYTSMIGRRKSATARVRLYKKGNGAIMVNGLKLSDYFPMDKINIIKSPLKLIGKLRDFNISVVVSGGGKKGQADAIRHGISRALIDDDKELRLVLKLKGWLTRDARKKERKKPGLKRARKSPQWSKR